MSDHFEHRRDGLHVHVHPDATAVALHHEVLAKVDQVLAILIQQGATMSKISDDLEATAKAQAEIKKGWDNVASDFTFLVARALEADQNSAAAAAIRAEAEALAAKVTEKAASFEPPPAATAPPATEQPVVAAPPAAEPPTV